MPEWYDRAAANDRFVFALAIALVAHVGFILGVGFRAPHREPPPASLEVTLAQYRSEVRVEDAEFLAQFEQRGGGEHERSAEPLTPVAAAFESQTIRDLRQDQAPPAPPPEPGDARLATELGNRAVHPADEPPQRTTEVSPAPAPQQRSATEIASLIARLDEQSRAYAARPRVERLTSVSAQAAADAAYLLAWTQRIEAIGNRNYPLEARRRRLSGDLRLLVALRPDGNIDNVRVLQSSGQRVLDDAAVRIVHLAAPFAAFPPELRARSDVLEIIRTWQFRSDRLSARE